jgi:hypothetical protein
MMIQVTIIHPADMEQADTLLINAANIVCIGSFPVVIMKYNPFSNQQEPHSIEPPKEYFTMLINSNILPAVFIHKDSYSDIQAEFENLNINEF